VLTVRGWSNWILFSCALGAIVLFASRTAPRTENARDPLARLYLLALIAPVFAVVVSLALRGDWNWSELDAPARFWAGALVFMLALRWRLDAARWLRMLLPLALALTLVQQYIAPQPRKWTEERMSTYFADPLVFGYLSLAFALMCFMAASPQRWRERPAWLNAITVAALPVGAYLSIESGSRTGWLAVPILIVIWLQLYMPAPRRWGRAFMPLVFVLAAAGVAALGYASIPRVHERVHEAVSDVTNYSFEGVAPVSPVGMRITYLRIASDLIRQHPLAGVGDTSHRPPVPKSAFPYADDYAVFTAFRSGMHNQVVTNTVRWGVLGGATAALLLVVPLVIFGRAIRSSDPVLRENAAMGLAFSLLIFVASFTTEVVDLKYTASFHALMTSLLAGACLGRHGQD
jgi:O-antigen ligase